jgi:hypothetical protein
MQKQNFPTPPGVPARITKITDRVYGLSLKLPPQWIYIQSFKYVLAVVEAPGGSSWHQELTFVRETKGGRRIYAAKSPGGKMLKELYEKGIREIIVSAMYPVVSEGRT